MIHVQEVAESSYSEFIDLPNRTKEVLISRKCEVCDYPLLKNDTIHYVKTSNGKILWWHNHTK